MSAHAVVAQWTDLWTLSERHFPSFEIIWSLHRRRSCYGDVCTWQNEERWYNNQDWPEQRKLMIFRAVWVNSWQTLPRMKLPHEAWGRMRHALYDVSTMWPRCILSPRYSHRSSLNDDGAIKRISSKAPASGISNTFGGLVTVPFVVVTCPYFTPLDREFCDSHGAAPLIWRYGDRVRSRDSSAYLSHLMVYIMPLLLVVSFEFLSSLSILEAAIHLNHI